MSPKNSCPLGTSEYDLIWKKGLCRCSQVHSRSCWTRVYPESSKWCPYKKRRGHTQREDGHVMTDEGTGLIQPQAKEHKGYWKLPEAGETARKCSSLEPFKGAWPC